MPDSRPFPFSMNRPLGLIGLFLAAGATGIYAVSNTDATDPMETSAPGVEPNPGRVASGREPATRPISTDVPATPLVTVQSAPGSGVMPASASSAEIVFIVRIKGAPEIDTIARNFKRDRAAADAAFADLVASRPALSEFTLVGASYSGEIKLSYLLPPGVSPTRDVVMEIKDRIMAVEGVAYADPDYVAQPGKEK